MKYNATFIGSKIGAIGTTYPVALVITAKDEEEARLRLYDTHEHISNVRLQNRKK